MFIIHLPRALGLLPPFGDCIMLSQTRVCKDLSVPLFSAPSGLRSGVESRVIRQCYFQFSEELPTVFFPRRGRFPAPPMEHKFPCPHAPDTGFSGFLQKPLNGCEQTSVISSNFIFLYYVRYKSRKTRIIRPMCPGLSRYNCQHGTHLVGLTHSQSYHKARSFETNSRYHITSPLNTLKDKDSLKLTLKALSPKKTTTI